MNGIVQEINSLGQNDTKMYEEGKVVTASYSSWVQI